MNASSKSRSTLSAVCISNGVVRVRMRATIGPQFPHASRASTFSPSSANLPLGRGKLLTTRIEHTRTHALLVVSLFVRGHRTICNLFKSGRSQPSGLSFSSRVHACKQPRGVFAISSSPTPLLSANHVNHKAWSNGHAVHENRANGA
jgi:hypothetical protein